MSNFIYHIQDGNSGAAIQGAAINDVVSTNCCDCWPSGCSGCNGCTSGSGFTVLGNSDQNGNYAAGTVYTCPMGHDVLVTAVGYNPTHIQAYTGAIDGDAAVGQANGSSIQLVPLANVAQSNQGGAGTAGAAVSGAAATTPGTGSIEVYAVIGVAVLVVIVVLGMLLHHHTAAGGG
jgi:hypothetical protein